MKQLIFTVAAVLTAFVISESGNAQSLYPGQHKEKLKVESYVPLKAQCFDLKYVRLLPGRVHDNLMRDSIWLENIRINSLLHSFRNNSGVFAGLEGGYESVKKYGGWESLDCDLRGHTTGHLLSAYALMNAATGSYRFKLKGDSIVAALAEVQEALGSDGYLSAFPEELINRNLRGKSVWAPWYTLHKIMSGLIDQYLYCDNIQALEVAVKMGNWAYKKLAGLPEETRRLMLRNEFGGMNEAFYNLYSITDDARYKTLAEFFYHDDVIDPLKEGNTDFGSKHTNTFIPKVIGEARNYELTSCKDSRDVACLFWEEMVNRHAFVTGSLSQKEHYFNPDRMSHFLNGYTGETCCTYNILKLTRHIFCWDASPEAADYYERALFNHILAQQDTQSGMVCYFLPLLSGAYKVYSTPEHSFWCCVGSGFESHAKYAESIYFHNGNNEVMVNLFISSVVNWEEKGFKMKQITEFPSSEEVTFIIEEAPSTAMQLSLRYPSWSGIPVVKVNGKIVKHHNNPSSYIKIERKWNKGDEVTVSYPMSLRVETLPDNPHKGALLYGPVVLAGDLGCEGMTSPAPFSDPTVRNDYYNYNYNIPDSLPTYLDIDRSNPDKTIRKDYGSSLNFITPTGIRLAPLYDTNHTRYVVYWDL